MNESEIINIELLKDYCLGFLNDKQKKKVELICMEHPEIAQELLLLRLSFKKYTGNQKILHRVNLRKNVWKAIQNIWERDS